MFSDLIGLPAHESYLVVVVAAVATVTFVAAVAAVRGYQVCYGYFRLFWFI